MKTTDFSTKLTSSKIKENINKMFGVNVAFEKYSREQLEDIRNKLRTRMFQLENSAGINDLLTNEAYQKDKAMLALLNTRIKEMLGEDIAKLRDKLAQLDEAKKGVKAPKFMKHAKGSEGTGDDKTGDGKKDFDDVQVARMVAGGVPKKKAIAKATSDEFKEGWDDMMKASKERSGPQPSGGSGVKKGRAYGGSAQKDAKEPEEKKAKKTKESVVAEKAVSKSQQQAAGIALAAKRSGKAPKKGSASAEMSKMPAKELEKFAKTKHKGLPAKKKADESAAIYRRHVQIVNESLAFLLRENEEEKAKAITAAGDMVNDYTSWMQRVGQYQTKSMIELADAIRSDFGAAESEAFKAAVGPALQATLEVLTQQREAISNAVAVLAGEAVPGGEPMGAEPAADMSAEPAMEPAEPDMMNEPAGDEFAASDAAAGAGAAGREVRESKFAKRLAESHSIISKLAK